ncbi:MAG: PIN domain nuclease [Deltaproteobacteria bacterium]|nr:PIN domain nuclease [Deltaproteobacteria bacterium]
MILVDTSVWIDFFRSHRGAASLHLATLIRGQNRVCICGLIRQEILQGIHHPQELAHTLRFLRQLPFLNTRAVTYDRAAELFRLVARHGTQIPTVDATIAAIAIEHTVPLFTLDRRHFFAIAQMAPLHLYEVE